MDKRITLTALLLLVATASLLAPSLKAAPLIRNNDLSDAVVDQNYTVNLQAMNGRAPYNWSATSGLPSGLVARELIPNAWVIIGKPDLGTEGDYDVVLRVTDSVGDSAEKTLVLTVLAAPPELEITTATLDKGKEGEAYSFTLEAEGGVGAYDWRATSGLPAGLSIGANKIIGTPTAGSTGTHSITLVVTDGDAPPGRDEVTLDLIVEPADPLEFVTEELDDAQEEKLYIKSVKVSGGIEPYTWSDPVGIPDWLEFANGSLAGNPPEGSADGSPYAITFSVTDSSVPPETIEKSFNLVVVGPIEITTETLPDAWEGESYTTALSARGGSQPYDWRNTVGLPDGLTISKAGMISGTPAAGSHGEIEITAKVKDDFGKVATQPLTLVITPSLAIDTTALNAASEEESYNTTLLASGGHAPYIWEVSGLPRGMSADSETGIISGTPVSGSSSISPFSVAIDVFDSFKETNTASITLELEVRSDNPPPTILTSSLPDVEIAERYRVELQADFGFAPYRWSARGLPSGMYISMEDTGTFLIGAGSTAFAGKTFSLYFDLTDSGEVPQHTTKSLTLSFGDIDVSPPSILNSFLPPVTAGEFLTSVDLDASGGTPDYFWTMQSDLPGLTLNSENSKWQIEGFVAEGTISDFYNVTLTVYDSSQTSLSDAVTLTLFVLPAIEPPADDSDQRDQEEFFSQAVLEGAAAGVCSLRHNSTGRVILPLVLFMLGVVQLMRRRESVN